MELSEQPLAVKMLCNSGYMWPSVVVHDCRIGGLHVYLACQSAIKNVQVHLTVKGKTTPDSYTPIPKNSCAQNVVVLK